MLPISIDLSGVIEEFSFSKEEIKGLGSYVLDRLATEFTTRWEDEINASLHSTRNEYKRGIFSENPDDKSVVIGLNARQSPLSLMLEDGASSFDIKQGMEKSPKKHATKGGGWYMSIPFRYATSEAVGEAASFSARLPKPIENIVKTIKQPLPFNKIPGKFQGMGENKTSGYKHQFNIYEGLQREEIGSGKEKRGGYMNFRRISDKSDPASWIHPGFAALHLMDAALESMDIGRVVDDATDEFLSNR